MIKSAGTFWKYNNGEARAKRTSPIENDVQTGNADGAKRALTQEAFRVNIKSNQNGRAYMQKPRAADRNKLSIFDRYLGIRLNTTEWCITGREKDNAFANEPAGQQREIYTRYVNLAGL